MAEFIAHIREDGTKQSVKDHLENTSSLCGQFSSKIGCESIGKMIGLLHDQGKYTEFFEKYILQSYEGNRSQQKKNHSSAGAQHIINLTDNSLNPIEMMATKFIAETICCHHSGLCDNLTPYGKDSYTLRVYPETNISYEETYKNFIDELNSKYDLKQLFKKSVDELKDVFIKISKHKLDLGYSIGMIQKYLFSCLIDADRLDTAIFMQGKSLPKKQDNLPLWNLFANRLDEKLDAIPLDSTMAELRRKISLECKASAKREPGIYTLNCPTGSGKTLASMRYAVHHAKEFDKERIFYIIPFTTIIDQNADSIRTYLSEGENDQLVNQSVMELHSALVNDNKDEDYKLLTERMDAPMVLTTMVRFLETFFAKSTQNPRTIHQFANSVILFDEIQTLPIKCVHLFNSAINFLVKVCGATVILCTATQPLLHRTKKPILLSENPDLVHNTSEMTNQFKRVKIESKCKPGGYHDYEVADLIMQTALKEKKLITIMNTKSSARAVFEAVEERNSILPTEEKFTLYFLSTAFCPQHRRDILKAIRDKLEPNNDSRIICITTQLIEAGVDISFNAVLRALAGLDSIVQAAGRCNRHGKAESIKTVTIFNPNFESLSRLVDIQVGARQMERLLSEFEENKSEFDNDLLSQKAIETYFRYYFTQRESIMDYPVEIKDKNTTIQKNLYELLSNNSSAWGTYRDIHGKPYPDMISQSFETAGKIFKAIDNNTIAVIVPYQRGKEIIARLGENCNLEEKLALLKEAQQYSVNLFTYEQEKLKDVIFEIKESGVLALAESYYSKEKGICFLNMQDGALTM